jgi:hypothetical protein
VSAGSHSRPCQSWRSLASNPRFGSGGYSTAHGAAARPAKNRFSRIAELDASEAFGISFGLALHVNCTHQPACVTDKVYESLPIEGGSITKEGVDELFVCGATMSSAGVTRPITAS